MSVVSRTPFEAFIEQHLEYLLARSRHLERSRDDANDLVQDTIEKALRHFSHEHLPYGRRWLARIMTNLFLDRCRRRQRNRHDVGIDVDTLPAIHDADAEPVWMALSSADVELALEHLGHPFRTVFVRSWQLSQSQQEIASALGIPQRTVATRLYRARLKLRQTLAKGLLDVDRASVV